jgi:Lar family restriction alleviation protein
MTPLTDQLADALRPCPFCGGEATLGETRAGGLHWWHVRCEACDIDGPSGLDATKAKAIAAWNTRVEARPVEPVAWLYTSPDGKQEVHDRRPTNLAKVWTETPLFAAPPRREA